MATTDANHQAIRRTCHVQTDCKFVLACDIDDNSTSSDTLAIIAGNAIGVDAMITSSSVTQIR